MAQIWKLPVVFVCENNLYMEYTLDRRRDRRKEHPAADRASRLRARARCIVDGNDVDVGLPDGGQTALREARA